MVTLVASEELPGCGTQINFKMKKIGILTSGGDCGGLNAAVRSIFFRAKNTYGMEVLGIQDGTVGLMQRPVAFLPLDYQTFSGSLLRQGGTFLGTTNKGNPFKFPMPDGSYKDRTQDIIDGYHELGLEGLIVIGGDGSMSILTEIAKRGNLNIVAIPKQLIMMLVQLKARLDLILL